MKKKKKTKKLNPCGRKGKGVKKNKRRNPAGEAAASEAYEKFHWGDPVDEKIKAQIEVPKTLFGIGELVSVEYQTHKGGEKAIFRHSFKKKNRPFLASDPDGKQLFIIGGNYVVAPEGITD